MHLGPNRALVISGLMFALWHFPLMLLTPGLSRPRKLADRWPDPAAHADLCRCVLRLSEAEKQERWPPTLAHASSTHPSSGWRLFTATASPLALEFLVARGDCSTLARQPCSPDNPLPVSKDAGHTGRTLPSGCKPARDYEVKTTKGRSIHNYTGRLIMKHTKRFENRLCPDAGGHPAGSRQLRSRAQGRRIAERVPVGRAGGRRVRSWPRSKWGLGTWW